MTSLQKIFRLTSSCQKTFHLSPSYMKVLPSAFFSTHLARDVSPASAVEPNQGPDQVLPAKSHKCWDAASPVQLQLSPTGPASTPPLSVHSFFKEVAHKHPEARALGVKRQGDWIYWNYEEYFDECRTVAKAYIKLGLDRFAGVCIMGFNSPEWKIASFGSIFAGGISVGIYTTNSPSACRYVAKDCGAQILVLEDALYVDKFMEVRDQLPDVKAIVQWCGTPTVPGVLSWQDLRRIGMAETDDLLEERLKLQAVNQCCTLIYTSGTTGPSKGVMCSQDNLTWSGTQSALLHNPTLSHRSGVSYLPLSHSAALMIEAYSAIPTVSTVYYADHDALKGTLGNTLKEIQPLSFLAVPRVWEKFYEKINEATSKKSPRVQSLINWARSQGLNYHMALIEGRKLNAFEMWKVNLARRLVLDKLREALGLTKVINIVSGSAPLTPEMHSFFMSIDLPISETYSLTETMIVGCSSLLRGIRGNDFKIGSVGKVVPQTEMQIMKNSSDLSLRPEEGEICFKGRSICMGYINKEDETNKTIRDDGWLQTGDLGWLDSEGFLYISGRSKELIITAGGENIPPVVIEEAIKKELSILSNAMLCGDKRKYLAILLTVKCNLDEETGAPLDTLAPSVVAWCTERGLNFSTVTELRSEAKTNRSGAVAKAVQAAIDRYNTDFAISNAQKVQRWTFLPHDFSLSTGELNNTLKLKRSVAAEMYSSVIDQLYGDDYPCA